MSDRRRRFIDAARAYLGTAYGHQGRRRRGTNGPGDPGAVDCATLVLLAARDAGLGDYDRDDYRAYPRMAPSAEALLDLFVGLGSRRLAVPHAQPGDILLTWFHPRRRWLQHVSIVTDLGIIHCYQDVGRVTEHGLSPEWVRRSPVAAVLPPFLDDPWDGEPVPWSLYRPDPGPVRAPCVGCGE